MKKLIFLILILMSNFVKSDETGNPTCLSTSYPGVEGSYQTQTIESGDYACLTNSNCKDRCPQGVNYCNYYCSGYPELYCHITTRKCDDDQAKARELAQQKGINIAQQLVKSLKSGLKQAAGK